MSDTANNGTDTKTPWHLWTVGVISLLWNSFGAFDYTMTNMQGEAYLKANEYSAEQIAYFTSFPVWAVALWAVGVWGAVLGSILLLLRKKQAVPIFTISMLALIFNSAYLYGFANGIEMMGTGGMVFAFVLFLIALFLVVYSRKMRDAGRLT